MQFNVLLKHNECPKFETNKSLDILKMLAYIVWGGESEYLVKVRKSIKQSRKLHYGSILLRTASESIMFLLNITNNTERRLAIDDFKISLINRIFNNGGNSVLKFIMTPNCSIICGKIL